MKTNAELRELAQGIAEGRVFTDWHLHTDTEIDLLQIIFMPLALMSEDQFESFKAKEPYLLYEYMSAALPRGINGYPVFTSIQYLTKQETEIMSDYLRKYQDMKKAFNEEQDSAVDDFMNGSCEDTNE